MAFILTPVCDRCGVKGYANQQFAQIKVISSQGHIRTMELCGGCEEQLGGWMDGTGKTDERGNDDGTD